jgi:hypothetical protein
VNQSFRGKAISITYLSARVCACVRAGMGGCACASLVLHIQYATRYCHIVSFMAFLALHYFFTFSHERQDFRKKVIDRKMCFALSANLYKTFLILRII